MTQETALNEQLHTSMPLSEKQARTLETALEKGCFETPRDITLKDLAAELDISHQALSERLRRAMRSIVTAMVASDPESGAQLWSGSQVHNASHVHQHPHCPKLSGSGRKPRPVDRDLVDHHGLEPCPMCAETRSFGIPTQAAGGAD